jgi:predicted DsbA family dithiol-disulfide isomerase
VSLRVDIVSDVVCPWCVIGYLQFAQALSSLAEPPTVTLHWQPFELNPRLEPDGENLREHLARKAGVTAEQSGKARQQLTALGTELGFNFRFSDDMRIQNTFRAHQLLHWAGEQGRQTALKLNLFRAYFTEGRNINDLPVLVQVAEESGLPAAEAEQVLQDEHFAGAVRDSERRWQNKDISGVPAFVFDSRYAVLGAQGVAAFARVLGKTQGEA